MVQGAGYKAKRLVLQYIKSRCYSRRDLQVCQPERHYTFVSNLYINTMLVICTIGENDFVKSVVYVLQTQLHFTLLIVIGSEEFVQFMVTNNTYMQ